LEFDFEKWTHHLFQTPHSWDKTIMSRGGPALEAESEQEYPEGSKSWKQGALVIKQGNTTQAVLTGREEIFLILSFWDITKIFDSKRRIDKRKSEWQTQICWHEPVGCQWIEVRYIDEEKLGDGRL
jgi:hypothetical protein